MQLISIDKKIYYLGFMVLTSFLLSTYMHQSRHDNSIQYMEPLTQCQCHQTRQSKPVEFCQYWNQQATSCPVHSVSYLPQIRCLINLRIESSIISTGSNITDNIIRKVINVLWKKCRTKNEALRNSNIHWIFLWRFLIQDHSKLSIKPEIPQDISLWKRQACQTLSKALDISSATTQVAQDLLKALAILSDTTVRRYAVDWEDLKTYWKSEKKATFL